MNNLFCPYGASSSCSFGSSIFDFVMILVVLFFFLSSFATPSSMGMGCEMICIDEEPLCNNNARGKYSCLPHGGCPFVNLKSKRENVKPKEESPEKKAAREHKQKIQSLVYQNQILAYELEQAHLKNMIQKYNSDTEKLQTPVSKQDVSSETEIAEVAENS